MQHCPDAIPADPPFSTGERLTHMSDTGRQHPVRAHSHRATTSGQHLLYRSRYLCPVAALTALVLLVVETIRLGQPGQPPGLVIGAAATILLAVAASYGSVAAYIRKEQQREAELTDAARRDGVSLAVRTLQHRIGNKLAVTVGYGEMLLDDPRLPPDLKKLVHEILSSAMAAAAVVRKLDKQLARIELDRSVAGPEVLDVDASTQIDQQPPA
jgi:signal transduction histidine kinase